ncbi:MAG: 2'-5' RNA ligase family protein [Nanoarchaeota archaeon]
MRQAIVILPQFEGLSKVREIRKVYDPQYQLVKPHVTLVFPFTGIPEDVLDTHIKGSLKGISGFSMRLKGIMKSPKEYYLYLLVDEGKKEILNIHDKLYTKLLKRRTDIPYIPHVTIGVFSSKKEIDNAYEEIKKRRLDFSCLVKGVYLLTVADDLATLVFQKKYLF